MTHHIDGKHKPGTIHIGDMLIVSSRGKRAWCARLGAKGGKYGRERDFLTGEKESRGMNGQIVTYTFTVEKTGEYEVSGDEFGEFRYSFQVR